MFNKILCNLCRLITIIIDVIILSLCDAYRYCFSSFVIAVVFISLFSCVGFHLINALLRIFKFIVESIWIFGVFSSRFFSVRVFVDLQFFGGGLQNGGYWIESCLLYIYSIILEGQ